MDNIAKAWNESQSAAFLGVHRQTLSNWRFFGKGPVYYKIGRKIIYYEKDLREFLNRNRVDPEKA